MALRLAPFLILALLTVCACKRTDAAPKAEPSLELTGRVVDAAQLLTPDEEARLTQKLTAAETAYGPQLAVVTVTTLNGQTIDKFGLDLANDWGLGDAKRSDGLLLIVAPNERQVRIEVGTGLEKSFNDPFAQWIIDENVIPRFKTGDFRAGIEAAVDAMIAKMKAEPSLNLNDNQIPDVKDKAA